MNFLWNFHKKVVRDLVSVELSVEIPQKVPRFGFRGNYTESSTALYRASWILPDIDRKQVKCSLSSLEFESDLISEHCPSEPQL